MALSKTQTVIYLSLQDTKGRVRFAVEELGQRIIERNELISMAREAGIPEDKIREAAGT